MDVFVPILTPPSYVPVNQIHLVAEPLVRHLHPNDVPCSALPGIAPPLHCLSVS
jgi:hypothetical protein